MPDNTTLQTTLKDSRQPIDSGHVALDEAMGLISRMRAAGMVVAAFSPPAEWVRWQEVPIEALCNTLQLYLTREGWRYLVRAQRQVNHDRPAEPLALSNPEDFLELVEQALENQIPAQESHRKSGETPPDFTLTQPAAVPTSGDGIAHRARQWLGSLTERMLTSESLPAPQATWVRLKAHAVRNDAQAQMERSLSEAARYAATMVGADAEREVVISRVEQLRNQMRNQLEVFCQEQGIPVPKPYSREEAYCLHLLTAHFVALVEAEAEIAKRGSALARQQIALEGERAAAHINQKLLPDLLDSLQQVNPLRERFLGEKVRHRSALLVGAVSAAVVGVILGVIEGISTVFLAAIARLAPVLAPASLVFLATLVAQTLALGGPPTLAMLPEFILSAAWNATLAFGVTLVAFGGWQYFTSRRKHTPTTECKSDDERPESEDRKHIPTELAG